MYGSFKFVSKTMYVPDEQKEGQEIGKPRVLFGRPEINCQQNIFFNVILSKSIVNNKTRHLNVQLPVC